MTGAGTRVSWDKRSLVKIVCFLSMKLMEHDAAHRGEDTDCPLLSAPSNSIIRIHQQLGFFFFCSSPSTLNWILCLLTHSGQGLAPWDGFGFIYPDQRKLNVQLQNACQDREPIFWSLLYFWVRKEERGEEGMRLCQREFSVLWYLTV